VAGRDEFDEVADELYGLALADFTAARTAAVAKAKQDGNAELARRIGELRKPVMAGWIANQLVRAYPDEVAKLAALGATLRDAMRRLDGEELRQAAGQQQQAVYGLVQRAEKLTPQGISAEAKRGLEQTLHAALVDPGVADALMAGRLTGPLSRSGFPDIVVGDLAAVPTGPSISRPAPLKRVPEVDPEEQNRAEAQAAAQKYATALQAVEEREGIARAAKEQVERLNEELEAALGAQHRAEADLRTARREARSAEQAARRAAQRLPQ
jgi:hypothetical protein